MAFAYTNDAPCFTRNVRKRSCVPPLRFVADVRSGPSRGRFRRKTGAVVSRFGGRERENTEPNNDNTTAVSASVRNDNFSHGRIGVRGAFSSVSASKYVTERFFTFPSPKTRSAPRFLYVITLRPFANVPTESRSTRVHKVTAETSTTIF